MAPTSMFTVACGEQSRQNSEICTTLRSAARFELQIVMPLSKDHVEPCLPQALRILDLPADGFAELREEAGRASSSGRADGIATQLVAFGCGT